MRHLERLPLPTYPALVLPVGLVATAAVIGWATARYGNRLAIAFIAAVAMALLILIAMHDWRKLVYGLLLYIPFTGIPIVLAYPNQGPITLVKDFVFVIPAYIGFLVAMGRLRRPLTFRGAPMALLALFALLVMGQVFNASVPHLLVGLIGLKVWLFYIPFLFLGYHMVESKAGLVRLLRLMCLIALVPTIIGLTQAMLLYSGRPDLAYSLYGPAAHTMTQNFTAFSFEGGGSLQRIPSTFSFWSQYTFFCAAMVAIGYGWLRTSGSPLAIRALTLTIILIASLLSGSRGVFITIPVLLAIIALLDGQGRRYFFGSIAGFSAALMGATIVLLGASPTVFIAEAWRLLNNYVENDFVRGIQIAISYNPLGLGAGTDTSPARYVSAFGIEQAAPLANWLEGWYAKATVELGIPGLILVFLLVGYLVIAGFRSHRTVRDPELRGVSAALLGYLIWNAFYFLKGSIIDIEPGNIFFWFFTGILLRVPTLTNTNHISTLDLARRVVDEE